MAENFGRVACDVAGFESAWVQFKTRGYPFKMRREWDEATTDAAVLGIVLRYVESWNLVDVDEQAAPVSVEALGNVEDALVMWLVRAFRRFWMVDLVSARPNSSPPPGTTP